MLRRGLNLEFVGRSCGLLEADGGQVGRAHVGEALHLEALRGPKQFAQLAVLHIDFPVVHELDESAELGEAHVLEYDDGVAGGVVDEEGLEVRGARAQDDLVGADGVPFAAGERHVHQGLVTQ